MGRNSFFFSIIQNFDTLTNNKKNCIKNAIKKKLAKQNILRLDHQSRERNVFVQKKNINTNYNWNNYTRSVRMA